jgi:uncharacterized protein
VSYANLLAGLLVAGVLLAGCGRRADRETTGARPAPVDRTQAALPDRAQPTLSTLKLWLGAQELSAELALRDDQITTGMMFRTNIAENAGMLFVFASPRQVSFWMKNVPIPLSCAYLDAQGVILEIHDMKPREETPITAGSDRIQYVLETAQGWFQRNQVGIGTLVRSERGSLQQTFFRRGSATR